MFAELWELLRSGAIRRHQDLENMKCEAIRVSLVIKIFFDHNILEIEGRQQLSVWFFRGGNEMRDISMERVNATRNEMLNTVKSPTLTHEQKVATMANLADSMLEVLDLPEGLDELLNQPIDKQCICDLSEGHAPLRPRYIVPDYAKFMREGSRFLQLDAPKDIYEAINSLLIFYKHVPSVTNFPVYVGALDELLEPFMDDVDEAQAKKLIKLFLTHMDRTILDSFSHANIGPKATRAGRLILEAEKELQQAVPNVTMKYDEDITPDDFALLAVDTALHCAKPSFANHKMFKSELNEDYVIASCYNGLEVRRRFLHLMPSDSRQYREASEECRGFQEESSSVCMPGNGRLHGCAHSFYCGGERIFRKQFPRKGRLHPQRPFHRNVRYGRHGRVRQ